MKSLYHGAVIDSSLLLLILIGQIRIITFDIAVVPLVHE